jgi:hypothetical protein
MSSRRIVVALVALLAAGVAALVIALVVVPFAGPSLAADGVSETRTVSGFDRIRLEGAFTSKITAGKGQTLVVVRGSRAAVARVTTEVRGDTLVVATRQGFGFFEGSPNLEIDLPALRGFANSGAGTTTIGGLGGGDIDLENTGAGTIVASGLAASENVSLAGVGKIDTTAVDARDVTVDNDGVGTVHVRASGVLTMNVNGVGEIRYAGNPSHVESQVNGIGRIGRL